MSDDDLRLILTGQILESSSHMKQITAFVLNSNTRLARSFAILLECSIMHAVQALFHMEHFFGNLISLLLLTPDYVEMLLYLLVWLLYACMCIVMHLYAKLSVAI